MKKRLSIKETIFISSMLFGMFFGAGNLIFPVFMGQQAGTLVLPAIIGFLITGVGLPLLGVTALGISQTGGLAELSSRVGKKYGIFFTCALYLTIGPFFAIPRCASLPFTVGLEAMFGKEAPIALLIFSALFFAVVLFFSLRPSGIMTWIGKILNPIFLMFLGVLVITALIFPAGGISEAVPHKAYSENAFFKGFLEGYNTMDALAGLAFGIVVVNVIKGLGVKKGEDIAKNTVIAGFSGCLIMAVIYILVTVMGVQSKGITGETENGAEALAAIAGHYFGFFGNIILTLIVAFACLKTAVGLITSCAETFEDMFRGRLSYKGWAVIFCGVSFAIANLGLSAIIEYAMPVLMFLYPLAITLILMALFGKLFDNSPIVYKWVTAFTAVAAFFDFIKALPNNVKAFLHLGGIVKFAENVIPMYKLGLGWICPAAVGLITGLVILKFKNKAEKR